MKLQQSVALGALFLCNLALADTAVIVQSIPVYENIYVTENRCVTETSRVKDNTREIGIGSILGAAIGSQYDTATAIGGLLLGGFIADKITETPRAYERCSLEPKSYQRVIGYDVKYVYNNKEYIQRLDYDPGVGRKVEVRTTIGR
jgi:uncharacterized protein YcfJ